MKAGARVSDFHLHSPSASSSLETHPSVEHASIDPYRTRCGSFTKMMISASTPVQLNSCSAPVLAGLLSLMLRETGALFTKKVDPFISHPAGLRTARELLQTASPRPSAMLVLQSFISTETDGRI